MIGRLPLLFLGLSAFVFAGPVWAGDFPYQQPPAEIRDVLNAPPAPVISVSPQRDYAIFLQGVRYPPIAEVAQPFLPLAGVRVDANTNGLHMAAYYVSLAIKRLPGGEDIAVALPRDGKFGAPVWSPDGKQFAFTNMIAKGIELWIGSPSTGQARRISGLSVNGVQTGGAAIQWLGDNRTLIVSTVPGARGPAPIEPAIPKGPHVQESIGNGGPAPTFEDLLSTPHDEDLFDYYATAQLVYLDAATGRSTPFGKPRIYAMVRPSPDQAHVLVGWLHKPYSYQRPAGSFPQEVEVWDRNGKVEYKVASLPLEDRVPLAGVRTGLRSYQWLPDRPATLVWAEALDGGEPKTKVPYRDEIKMIAAPFSAPPKEIFKTEQRFRSLEPLAGGMALVQDYERVKRIVRTFEISLDKPADTNARLVFSLNERDAYRDPGTPVLKTTLDGRLQVIQSGDEIYLSGEGSSPTGDHPFLDRFNLATGKAQRVFHSDSSAYETIVALLDDSGARLLTRRESPADPPNYYIRTGSEVKALTRFPNPAPQTAGIKKSYGLTTGVRNYGEIGHSMPKFFSVASLTLVGTSSLFAQSPAFAYVADSVSNAISLYSINQTTGALTQQAVFATPVPESIVVAPSGNFAYAANYQSSGTVSGFSINPTTGDLSPIAGSPFPAGSSPYRVTIAPSGGFLYSANYGSSNVSAFSVDPTTGALTPVPGSPFGVGAEPYSVGISTAWRREREAVVRQALAPQKRGPKSKRDPVQEEVQKLQKDNARLTEELRKAAIIIDVQKTLGTLLGWPLPTQEEIDKLL